MILSFSSILLNSTATSKVSFCTFLCLPLCQKSDNEPSSESIYFSKDSLWFICFDVTILPGLKKLKAI